MFDAYTIKKVMPRLVIALVLIQLSWPLFTGAITATNQIAWGIEGIMYMPFGGRDALDLGNSLSGVAGGGQLLAFFGAAGAWTLMGAPGAIALAIAILVSLVTAYFTLIVRQVVLLMLVLTGPIALVAWILPNTEKLWKLWWSTFTKALLMYPLVLMLVASGRIVASLVGEITSAGGMTKSVMILAVFFAPFFLLPKTFALAGGAIAGVSGAIASRGAKLRAASNKRSMAKQGKTWGARKQKFQAGGYGSNRNALTRGIRRAGLMSGQGLSTGFGTTKKGRQRMALAADTFADEQLKDPNFTKATFDDGSRLALQYGSEKAARQAVAESRANYATEADYLDAVSRGEAIGPISETSYAKARAVGYNRNTQLAALKAEAANKGRNYKGLAGIDALNARIDAVAADTGLNADDLRNDVAYSMRTTGGRYDLGKLNSDKTAAQQAIDGYGTGSLYQHANGTADSYSTIHEAFRNSGDPEGLAVFYEESKAMLPNSTGNVASEIDKTIGEGSLTKDFVKSYYSSGPVSATPLTMQETTTDPATGNQQTRTVQDPDPTRTVNTYDREQSAKKTARTYERPDPNNP